METIGVIPARYGSTRFEGKLLAELCGKSVLQHTWENAKNAKTLDELIIATDDKRIYAEAKGFGANVTYTSKQHKSGSDRLTEAIADIDAKIIVNIQADEPFLHPSMIDDVVYSISKQDAVNIATLCHKIKNDAELNDPNVVKVVIDKNGFALYFSRSVIPYLVDKTQPEAYYKHIGIYGYTRDFLFIFKSLPPSRLENIEKLEQLRVIENGYKIKVIETKYETIGIDTRADLERAVSFIKGGIQ